MSVVTVPGVLLRSYPYSETSLILRFLTPDHGVVSVVAKGVRRRSSRGVAPVETFQRGALTFHHREDRDLHGFRDFQAASSSRRLAGDLLRFSGASFLAELVLGHTLQEPNPSLHRQLVGLLDGMESAPPEALPGWILGGAWTLLVEFGFPPALEACIRCRRSLPDPGMSRFDVEGGGLLCASCGVEAAGPRLGPQASNALREMVSGVPPSALRGTAAHLSLVERYALHHLDRRRPFQATALLRTSLAGREPSGGEGSP
jgi:DNA repair protein RecO (recombination protein O)